MRKENAMDISIDILAFLTQLFKLFAKSFIFSLQNHIFAHRGLKLCLERFLHQGENGG